MFLRSEKKETRIETVIGSGTEVEGNLHTSEGLRVDGKVKGSVKAETVVVGNQGNVYGDVNANKVTISGKVQGNVSAATIIELLPHGQILGDICACKIIVSDGAHFEGNCHMIKADGHIIELNPELVQDENHGKNLKVIGQQKQKATA